MPLFNSMILWLVPMLAYAGARRSAPAHRGLISGLLLGAIISPASLGLYGLYFYGPIAALIGMFGLVMVLVHSAPGFYIANIFGLLESETIVEGLRDNLIIEGINSALWASVYGLLGAWIDRSRNRRSKAAEEF